MASRKGRFEWPLKAPLLVMILLSGISLTSAGWTLRRGYTLYYGDAQARVNIARRVVDTRAPGWKQFGTVWLPLPQAAMIPYVKNEDWWRSGQAGVLPSAAGFVGAGLFLFLALRRLAGSTAAAAAGLAAFALNPNLLYLQSTPMSEPLWLACLTGLLWSLTEFLHRPSVTLAALAGAAAFAGAWTRYEAWPLIPAAALAVLAGGGRKRWTCCAVFTLIAIAAPVLWLFYNWWYWGDWLEFYRGSYSAKAIYLRQLEQGMARYPGDGDWPTALRYLRAAVVSVSGPVLVWLGGVGLACALWKRSWLILLLVVPPLFIAASLHSGGTPIFLPHLWPYSYYNTRYALCALPLLSAGAAFLALLAPRPLRLPWATLVAGAALSPWLLHPGAESWIVWVEAERNSAVRRDWTRQAAAYLAARYRPGDGIFYSFGDLTGVLQQAGIPLREGLYDLIEPQWAAAHARPDLFLHERWALAFSGDSVASALSRTAHRGPKYECVHRIMVKGGPVIEIYKRVEEHPVYKGARSPERLPHHLGGGGSAGKSGAKRAADL